MDQKGINLRSWGGNEVKFDISKKTFALDNFLDLLKLLLPQFLVEHFDLVKSKQGEEVLHFYFEERNIPPETHSSRILVSKGFHKEITVQDFPLRGNKVFLHVKRRRWTDKDSGEIVQRDWNLVAQDSSGE